LIKKAGMKKLFLILLFPLFSYSQSSAPENIPMKVDYGKTNSVVKPYSDSITIAICTLNLITYKLDSINVTKYKKEFSTDTLPLSMYFDNNWDLAHLYFYYGTNLVFKGGTSWMGYGRIEYPVDFSADTSAGSYPVPLPNDTKYFHSIILDDSYCTYAQYLQKADSAWDKVKNLTLVSSLAENKYKVGIVAYSRTEGLFVPEFASWLIFIYSELYPESTNNITAQKVRIYPNPCKDFVNVEPLDGEVFVTDLLGRKVLTAHQNPIDVSSLAPGIYFILGDTSAKLLITR
jgi:hypothetical protein